MEPMVVMASRIATQVGADILKAHQNRHKLDLQTQQKGELGIDGLVTSVDHFADEKIVALIQKSYPDHCILSEEGGYVGSKNGDVEWQWLIDPLDGTTNFVQGIPHFCISMAVQRNGVTQHAVIFDPVRDELFTASRGGGAMLNQRRLKITERTSLNGAVVMVGQPLSVIKNGKAEMFAKEHFSSLEAVSLAGASIRRSGSAALDLAYVAAGRVDAFFELGLRAWDMAAGELLVKEAGGTAVDSRGGSECLESGQIIATSLKLLKPVMQTVVPAWGGAAKI